MFFLESRNPAGSAYGGKPAQKCSLRSKIEVIIDRRRKASNIPLESTLFGLCEEEEGIGISDRDEYLGIYVRILSTKWAKRGRGKKNVCAESCHHQENM